jgi:large subunit ribosomal protein L15
MKLHDLRPADGSRQPRTRVGRGIAAGKGKTAGRGTKGQKARAGGSIPPWFEGGQTPLHMRIPKLRGFKNRFRIEYEVVNIGAIGALADGGAFEMETSGKKPAKSAPITVNQDILRAVGLVRTLNKPLKILGAGELTVPLFVVADAFSASARAKIEAAGGSVNVLEIPTTSRAAIGVTPKAGKPATTPADEARADDAGADGDRTEAGPAKASPAKTAAPKASAPEAQTAKASTPKGGAKARTAKAPKAEAKAEAKATAAATADIEAAPADDGSATDGDASASDAAGAAEASDPITETSAADAEAPEAGTPSGDDA